MATEERAATRKRVRARADATSRKEESKSFADGPLRAEFPDRTVQEYAGAVYPVAWYEIYKSKTLYVAVSPAHPSGAGWSTTSAEEAIDDLRERIETEIRDIVEGGWNSWAMMGDNKLVPLPNELRSKWKILMRECLEEDGFEVRREDCTTTVTVFPSGV